MTNDFAPKSIDYSSHDFVSARRFRDKMVVMMAVADNATYPVYSAASAAVARG